MIDEPQTACPDVSCMLEVPDMAEGLGWVALNNGEEVLFWCVYHFPVEWRRLHNVREALDFYRGNIATRKKALAEHKDRVREIKAWAKSHNIL